MSLSHSPSIVTNGLVLCLDAANRKSYPGSGTTWTDLSGGGNNGTLVNGVGYNSSNLGSLSFDGVDDEISCGTGSLNNLNQISATMWINKTSTSSDASADRLMTKRSSSEGSGWWDFLTTSSHTFSFNADFLTTNIARETSNIIFLNTWYMISFTWDGSASSSNIKIYINNQEASYSSSIDGVGGRVSETTNDLVIGNADWANRPFKGSISQVSIYNRALTATEIAQNYNALKSRYI